LERIVRPVARLIRETIRWDGSSQTIFSGVIFSELGEAELGAAVERIESKTLSCSFSRALKRKAGGSLQISFYSYHEAGRAAGMRFSIRYSTGSGMI